MTNMTWDPVWEDVFQNQPWGRYPGDDLIRFVARNFYAVPDRSAVRILEVGCGPGANLWYLAREGFAFAGIDGSPTAVAQTAQRLDAECSGWRSRGSLHVGEIGHLPFPDEHFHAVIDSEALCCNPWAAAQDIYGEMARVTRPGGKLFSRTFSTGTWGEGTGESVGHRAWRCVEGPLAGKGYVRFTAIEEVPELLSGFVADNVELLTWSLDNRRQEVREWIIQATRKGGGA